MTEADAVTRRNLVLVKAMSTLKYSTQVNEIEEAVVTRIVTITRTEEDEFVGSVQE